MEDLSCDAIVHVMETVMRRDIKSFCALCTAWKLARIMYITHDHWMNVEDMYSRVRLQLMKIAPRSACHISIHPVSGSSLIPMAQPLQIKLSELTCVRDIGTNAFVNDAENSLFRMMRQRTFVFGEWIEIRGERIAPRVKLSCDAGSERSSPPLTMWIQGKRMYNLSVLLDASWIYEVMIAGKWIPVCHMRDMLFKICDAQPKCCCFESMNGEIVRMVPRFAC